MEIKLSEDVSTKLKEMVDLGIFSSIEAGLDYAVSNQWFIIVKIQRLHEQGKNLPLK